MRAWWTSASSTRTATARCTSVVAGFDWLLKNRNALHIRVLNLSLGTTQRSSYHEDLLAALAESAWFAGIAVVAAAGNDGPVPGTIATPGADPFIITAGSYDDQGTPSTQDDRESAFSSRGPTVDGFAKPDVLAPGRRVVSLRANGTQLELDQARARRSTSASGNGAARDRQRTCTCACRGHRCPARWSRASPPSS